MTAPSRPQVGRPPPLVLPTITRCTLANGLRIAMVEVGEIPKVGVRLVLDVGDVDEAPDEVWLSRLAVEFLNEGSDRRDGAAFAEAVAALGGDLAAESDDDTTTLRARVLSEHAPALVRLFGELVRTPRFPAEELPRLQADLLRRIDLARAQPQMLALARFRSALYGEHPYGRVFPGDGVIEGFTTERARTFFDAYAGAARAVLYVAGRFDPEAVLAAAEEALGDWPAGAPVQAHPPSPASERLVHVIDRPGAPQTTLYIGLPVPDTHDPSWVPLSVTNALLGGAFSSRITMNLREDKGYTYSPRSVISLRRRDAHWLQLADVTTAHTGDSLHEIFLEIERLRAESPPPEELEDSIRYVAGGFLMRYASSASLADQIAFLDLHGLDTSYATAFVDRAYALTPDDIRDTAHTYLRPNDMTIVAVGDGATIREQAAPYGRVVEGE
ncbi:MAG: pitrilysin family protein [Chloroflexi bacterium]|nr:pitrilysin family protein [Chloroflexota bacterium]MDA1003722.1 pitrilysin family protein [Chloroflexota bacterium]